MAEQNVKPATLPATAEVKPPTNVQVATEALTQLAAPPAKKPKRLEYVPQPEPEAKEPAPLEFAVAPEVAEACCPSQSRSQSGSPPEAKPEPEYPAELLRVAAQLGYSPEDVKEFGSPEKAQKHLQKVINAYHAGRQQVEPKPEPEKKEPVAEFDPLVAFDKDSYGEEVRGLAKYTKETREENRQLKEKLEQFGGIVQHLQQAEHQRGIDQHRRQLDASINKLSQYTHIYGDGEGVRLGEESAEYKARVQLDKDCAVIASGYKSMGMPIPHMDDLVTMAVRMKHGDGQVGQEAPKRDVSDRQRDDTGKFVPTARATNRNTVGVPSDQRDDRATLLD
jgi:hypothetical protein